MAKRGRPSRPYQPSWGSDPIYGLYKCHDGRWRIAATGEKFTEHDERAAVARFLEYKTGKSGPQIDIAPPSEGYRKQVTITQTGPESFSKTRENVGGIKIPEAALFSWLRQQLLERPDWLAKELGLPQLVRMRESRGVTCAALLQSYMDHNPSIADTKRVTKGIFNKLVRFCNAKTLEDLTQERLLKWRQSIETSKTIKSPATKKYIYGRVKSVISFGLKLGLPSEEITACLSRCKVLWTAEAMPQVKPKPITRDEFHALLAADENWRAWLLLGLNCCLHLGEVTALEWKDFDLVKGTYSCIREKEKRHRIPRAAVLWGETIEALKEIPKTGSPYVFVSGWGTRYNRNTRINDFAALRKKAGLGPEITFDTLRDGCYTVAACSGIDERQARVLAGHKAGGMQDHYVLRYPEFVAPVCAAVHKVYFG